MIYNVGKRTEISDFCNIKAENDEKIIKFILNENVIIAQKDNITSLASLNEKNGDIQDCNIILKESLKMKNCTNIFDLVGKSTRGVIRWLL